MRGERYLPKLDIMLIKDISIHIDSPTKASGARDSNNDHKERWFWSAALSTFIYSAHDNLQPQIFLPKLLHNPLTGTPLISEKHT